MMSELECIFKLGGSAVTVKDQLETEKLEEIQKVGQLLKRNTERQCILVHGAGSFGHFQAKEYGVAQGYRSSVDDAQINKVKTGFCKTRVSVTKLNHIIVKELVSQGIKAVGLSPCGSWITDDGQVVQSDMDSIKDLLDEGYLPVLHGDGVMDRHRGCTILSGDTVIETLCSEFRPKRVIFLADIEGVFDKPPSQQNAQLLPLVMVKEDGSLTATIATTCQAHDVTGGILKKLKSAASIVRDSKGETNVFVCGINTAAAYNAYIHGELLGERGTEVRLE